MTVSGLRYVLCPTIIRSLLSTGLFLPERVAALYVCVRGACSESGLVSFGKKVGTPATYEDSESALATGRVRVLVRRGTGCGIAYRPDDRERAGERYRRESQVHAHRLFVEGAVVAPASDRPKRLEIAPVTHL